MAADVPVWLKPKNLDTDQPEMKEAIAAGAAGLWLDERVFAQPMVLEKLQIFRELVHPVLTA